MKRIQQKSIWALFCAVAVSMLLGACDSPNTPTPNPGNGQQGQQGQKGGSSSGGGNSGGGTSSGAVAGGGSYSHTKAPLTPEGKALPGASSQSDDPGGGAGGGTPSETTVTVKVKTVNANRDGHAQVATTSGYFDDTLTVTVDKAADDAGFVAAALAKLADEVKTKAGVPGALAAGEEYKFTTDAQAETVVSAADQLTTTGSTIHVSKFVKHIKVPFKTISNAYAGHTALTNVYTTGNAVDVEVDLVRDDVKASTYLAKATEVLRTEIAAKVTAAGGNLTAAECEISSADGATTALTINDLTSGSTMYASKVAAKVKATVTLALAQATSNALGGGGALSALKVAVPTDHTIKGNTVIKMYESTTEAYDVTQAMMDEVGAAIKAAVGAANIGTINGKHAFFTADPPTAASHITTDIGAAGTLTKANHHNKTIYIGLLTNN